MNMNTGSIANTTHSPLNFEMSLTDTSGDQIVIFLG